MHLLAIVFSVAIPLALPLLISAYRAHKARQREEREKEWARLRQAAWLISQHIGPRLTADHMKYVVVMVAHSRFLATLPCAPDTHEVRHEEIVWRFEIRWGIRDVSVLGGGRLMVRDNAVTAYGSSGDYGPCFEFQLRPALEDAVKEEKPGAAIFIR